VAWAMVAERFGSKDALLDFVLAQYYERRLVVTPVSGSSGLQQVLAPINALRSFAFRGVTDSSRNVRPELRGSP
jgi:AcrR family transcriptional regulator